MAHLEGVRVLEFSHMVMGPTVGMILADLGAEVIKVEPLGGDKTRNLPGSGAGYFAMYNRNKRSITVDLKSAEGIEVIRALLENSDVMIENFRDGALDKLGLGYGAVREIKPNIIYQSCKGFLSGPYENR
ncbi:CoA transferase, partial [Planktomarina temperata]|nr:CoA transferase [Planktomarina temperata]